MITREEVTVHADGIPLAGTLLLPEGPAPFPVVLQGPGWLGLRNGKSYRRYHEAFLAAGYAVLVIDHRGFGDSGGDPSVLSPASQLNDLRAALAWLTAHPEIDPDRIASFGSGGTGGGTVFLLAAVEPRVRAVISQVPVADGGDWLHRMRSEHEWLGFLRSIEEDRRQRSLGGEALLVDPREQIMIPTPERRTTTVKQDVDGRVERLVRLSSADEIIRYRPIDAARGLATPAMVIAVEHDATTPTDHAVALYEAVRGPRRLVMQRGTTHYAAYDKYGDIVAPLMVEWLDEHLQHRNVTVTDRGGIEGEIRFIHPEGTNE